MDNNQLVTHKTGCGKKFLFFVLQKVNKYRHFYANTVQKNGINPNVGLQLCIKIVLLRLCLSYILLKLCLWIKDFPYFFRS